MASSMWPSIGSIDNGKNRKGHFVIMDNCVL